VTSPVALAGGMRAARPSKLLIGVMLLFSFYALIPVLYLVIASTKTENELFTTFGFALPDRIVLLENLKLLFSYSNGIYLTWFLNTLWYSTLSATGATILSAAAGYGLAHFHFRGREAIFKLILTGVIVPQTAIVIPIFLIMSKLGIVDTPAAVILPSLVFPLGVYLIRVFSEQSIPPELLEASRIDGSGELRTFVRIALPLMTGGLATVFLLSFAETWNNLFLPLVVLTSESRLTLTVGLVDWYGVAMGSTANGAPLFSLVITGALVSVLPVLGSFVVLYRFWQSGVTVGAVK
jgi:multiple sugar transport system permease protein